MRTIFRQTCFALSLSLFFGQALGEPSPSDGETLDAFDPVIAHVEAAFLLGHGTDLVTTFRPTLRGEAARLLTASAAVLRSVPDGDGLLPLGTSGHDRLPMWPVAGAGRLDESVPRVGPIFVRAGGADLFQGLDGTERFSAGAPLVDGASGQLRVDAAWSPSNHVGLVAGARLESSRRTTRVRWPRASVVFRGLGSRVTFGREHRWWGPGVLHDVMLTTNAFPGDAIEIATDGTQRLPVLGAYRAAVFLAYYDDAARPTPYPLLFGHRTVWRAASWFEIGAERTIMLGGTGRTERYNPRILWDIFLGRGENQPNYVGFRDTDHKVGFDAVLFLEPFIGSGRLLRGGRVFFRYAGDDGFENGLPTRVAHHYGGTFLFPHVRVDLEFLDTVASGLWYWNNEYPAGYTYRGDFLATDLGWDGESGRLRVLVGLSERWGLRMEVFSDQRGFRFRQGPTLEPVRGGDRSVYVETGVALTRRVGSAARATLEYRYRDAHGGFAFERDRRTARHVARLAVRLEAID